MDDKLQNEFFLSSTEERKKLNTNQTTFEEGTKKLCFESALEALNYSGKKVIYDFGKNATFISDYEQYSEWNNSNMTYFQATFKLPEGVNPQNIKNLKFKFPKNTNESDQKIKTSWGTRSYYGKKIQDLVPEKFQYSAANYKTCYLAPLWDNLRDSIKVALDVEDKDMLAVFIAKVQMAFTWFVIDGDTYIQILFELYRETWSSRVLGATWIPLGESLELELY